MGLSNLELEKTLIGFEILKEQFDVWLKSKDQLGLSGNKSGTFNLTTTGNITTNSLRVQSTDNSRAVISTGENGKVATLDLLHNTGTDDFGTAGSDGGFRLKFDFANSNFKFQHATDTAIRDVYEIDTATLNLLLSTGSIGIGAIGDGNMARYLEIADSEGAGITLFDTALDYPYHINANSTFKILYNTTNIFDLTTTGDLTLIDDLHIKLDDKKLYFGTANDAYIQFTGTAMEIKPNAVTGTNPLNILTGNFNVIETSTARDILASFDHQGASGTGSVTMQFKSNMGDTQMKILTYDLGGNYIQSANYANNGNQPMYWTGYNGNQGSTFQTYFTDFIIKATNNALAGLGNSANHHLMIYNAGNDTGEGAGICFNISASAPQAGAAIVHTRTGSYSKGRLSLYTKTDATNLTAPVERIRIEDDGNVHLGNIGTTELIVEGDGDTYFNGSGAGLPFAEIYVADGSTAQTIGTGATYTKSTTFATNGQSNNCTADAANDKITITKPGIYKVNITLNGSIDTANTRVDFAVFKGGTICNNIKGYFEFVAANKECGGSACGLIDVTSANTDIDLRIRHDDGGDVDVTCVNTNLNVVQIGGT